MKRETATAEKNSSQSELNRLLQDDSLRTTKHRSSAVHEGYINEGFEYNGINEREGDVTLEMGCLNEKNTLLEEEKKRKEYIPSTRSCIKKRVLNIAYKTVPAVVVFSMVYLAEKTRNNLSACSKQIEMTVSSIQKKTHSEQDASKMHE
ncbi:hypothetical protein NEAUS04_1575 [Nematocida ausubeli]|nr:hypothetical protein NEAUS07_1618 [Nematocida ausubeli]KAI5136651.1 hypothetical protein NEAUS07_1653 [Nematocida ausubeli]KAI5163419.1 hypothetical protein NEAUS04_1547 [Nematocida ausubeli]KAI5163450.1 hypothetical protein NEAUS04_1575 [Nematocida ausubeli]